MELYTWGTKAYQTIISIIRGEDNRVYFIVGVRDQGGVTNASIYYWSEETGVILHSQPGDVEYLLAVENDVVIYQTNSGQIMYVVLSNRFDNDN